MENEENLFDGGLYLGIAGTATALVLDIAALWNSTPADGLLRASGAAGAIAVTGALWCLSLSTVAAQMARAVTRRRVNPADRSQWQRVPLRRQP